MKTMAELEAENPEDFRNPDTLSPMKLKNNERTLQQARALLSITAECCFYWRPMHLARYDE